MTTPAARHAWDIIVPSGFFMQLIFITARRDKSCGQTDVLLKQYLTTPPSRKTTTAQQMPFCKCWTSNWAGADSADSARTQIFNSRTVQSSDRPTTFRRWLAR